jgi:hypothetical protein
VIILVNEKALAHWGEGADAPKENKYSQIFWK